MAVDFNRHNWAAWVLELPEQTKEEREAYLDALDEYIMSDEYMEGYEHNKEKENDRV